MGLRLPNGSGIIADAFETQDGGELHGGKEHFGDARTHSGDRDGSEGWKTSKGFSRRLQRGKRGLENHANGWNCSNPSAGRVRGVPQYQARQWGNCTNDRRDCGVSADGGEEIRQQICLRASSVRGARSQCSAGLPHYEYQSRCCRSPQQE